MLRWPGFARPERPEKSSDLGRWGEEQAARFLGRKGYQILYRNFRARHGGEVDLVCRHGEQLVFVEVKTRAGQAYGRPSAAVNRDKQRLLARGAMEWLRLLDNPEVIFRFDIVEVLANGESVECEVIENAFELPEPYLY